MLIANDGCTLADDDGVLDSGDDAEVGFLFLPVSPALMLVQKTKSAERAHVDSADMKREWMEAEVMSLSPKESMDLGEVGTGVGNRVVNLSKSARDEELYLSQLEEQMHRSAPFFSAAADMCHLIMANGRIGDNDSVHGKNNPSDMVTFPRPRMKLFANAFDGSMDGTRCKVVCCPACNCFESTDDQPCFKTSMGPANCEQGTQAHAHSLVQTTDEGTAESSSFATGKHKTSFEAANAASDVCDGAHDQSGSLSSPCRSAVAKDAMRSKERNGQLRFRRRSDAALLVGLAAQVHYLGHVKIQSVRVLIHPRDDHGSSCESDKKSDVHGSYVSLAAPSIAEHMRSDDSVTSELTHVNMSLLITVSIPNLNKGGPFVKTASNVMRRKKRRRQEAKVSGERGFKTSAAIPSCTQLLFALIRSDWGRLAKEMQRAALISTRPNNTFVAATTLFPSNLSLEELYMRINDSLGVDDSTHRGIKPLCSDVPSAFEMHPSKQVCAHDGASDQLPRVVTSKDEIGSCNQKLFLLPVDILSYHIAPCLRARSLDALRRTCRHFHRLLRSIVPGLKLSLFRHQIASLAWMRRREMKSLSEIDALAVGETVEEDLHRSISCGATVLLSTRKKPRDGLKRQYYRWDTTKGCVFPVPEVLPKNDASLVQCTRTGGFKSMSGLAAARGGLLCDDPGLGKTITVLSLILQTLGQSTETCREQHPSRDSQSSGASMFSDGFDSTDCTYSLSSEVDGVPSHCNDEAIFHAYWNELPPCSQAPALLQLVNKIRALDRNCFFNFPVEGYSNPSCLNEVFQAVGKGLYTCNFDALCKDMIRYFRNVMKRNSPEDIVHREAKRLLCSLGEIVVSFKKTHLARAQRSTSRARDGTTATILNERKKFELQKTLIPSSGTLLVVPTTLLYHWEEQILKHIDFSWCTKGKPIIFKHSSTKTLGVVAHQTYLEVKSVQEMEELLTTSSAQPLVFFDESAAKELPSAKFLAMFPVVITNSQRLALEWKNGNVEEELRLRRSDRASYRFESYINEYECGGSFQACPLLKVHWLRMVVDEGHNMGGCSSSNAVEFASWINAQRRWAMTGTPTPQTASRNGLRNILGLMKYLRHEFLISGPCGNKGYWQQCIEKSWRERNLSSFFRLKQLLRLLMRRHTKDSIAELPRPKFVRTVTEMSPHEIITYNSLTSVIQTNIVVTSMEGGTSGWQDSLLNPRQSKHARDALRNVRLACCGTVGVIPKLKEKSWHETMNLLEHVHNADATGLTVVRNFLHRATIEQISSCMKCGLQLQTLLVVPCTHLVCTECIDSDVSACPLCGASFDVDDFQRLQPGFDLSWRFNVKDENMNHTNSSGLLETPPLVQNGLRHERDDDAHDGPDRGPQIVIPGRPQARRSRRRAEPHTCVFPTNFIDGKCVKCLEVHDACDFMNPAFKCSTCHKKAEECPKEETKSYYVVNKLLTLHEAQTRGEMHMASDVTARIIGEQIIVKGPRLLKAIIFSQFRGTLDVVGDRLLRRFGSGCVAEYWGRYRSNELKKFRHSPACFCMMLGKDGSHGLDLSFVTHIFFMEEIWDKSLEDQVVARAYRMGAEGRVDIEQLVAKHSVEELMVKMNSNREDEEMWNVGEDESVILERDSKETRNVSGETGKLRKGSSKTRAEGKRDVQQAKLHYLLSNLKFVRPTLTAQPLKSQKKTVRFASPARERQKQDSEVLVH